MNMPILSARGMMLPVMALAAAVGFAADAVGELTADPDAADTPGYEKFRNLPSGYRQVAYLKSNGNQYIDTRVMSSPNLVVDIDMAPQEYKNYLGQSSGDTTDWHFSAVDWMTFFDCGNARAGNVANGSGGYSKTGARFVWPLNDRYRVHLASSVHQAVMDIFDSSGSNVYWSANGYWASYSTLADFTRPLHVFGAYNGGNAKMQLWSLAIRDGRELVRDYVPAQRESDGVYGLYDLVNGEFATSSSASAFVAADQGPVVNGLGVTPALTCADDVWRLSLDVTSGTGDLYATVEDESGERKRALLKSSAAVGDALSFDFTGLVAGRFYTIGYLTRCTDATTGALVDRYVTVRRLYNGPVTLTKLDDADEGTGAPGHFEVALPNGVVAPENFDVAYTVDSGSTAVADQTYVRLPGTVTILARNNSAKVTVVPLDDPAVASDATVSLRLAPGGYRVGTDSAQTMTIGNGESFGGWIYNASAGTISDGTWQFAVSCVATNWLKVGAVNVDSAAGPVPASATPLDFSKAVVSPDGARWVLYNMYATFSTGDSDYYAPAQCVSSLTLPEDGLAAIEARAFNGLKNAEGEVVLPQSLRELGLRVFMKDTKLVFDAAKFPQHIIDIEPGAFNGTTKLTGDLYLPDLITEDQREEFMDVTGLTSVHFGHKTLGLWSPGGQQVFPRCTSLTNVTFAAASVTFRGAGIFYGCSSFKDVNLSHVGTIEGAMFNAASGVERITFDDAIASLPSEAFKDAGRLSEIVFTGPPPATFGLPYASGIAQAVTTRVHRKQLKVKNSAGKCWLDYAANGEIRYRGTTFASDMVSVDPSLRPLVTIEPEGILMFVR